MIAKKITGSFVLKIISTLLSFCTGVLLSRILGVEEYGLYSFNITIVFFLGLPAGLGLKQILVREVAKYTQQSLWLEIRKLLEVSKISVIFSSIILISVTVLLISITQGRIVSKNIYILYLALFSLPFSLLCSQRQAALQGLRYVVIGQIPEALIQPILFILTLISLNYFNNQELNATLIMAIKLVTIIIAFIIGSVFLKQVFDSKLDKSYENVSFFNWQQFNLIPVQSILPFMLISGMHLISNKMDVLMLGLLKGTQEVGIYTVVSRGSLLINFILMSFNISLAPIITSLYLEKNHQKIQKIATKTSRLTFLLALLFTISFILLGKQFLWIFGKDYQIGYVTLIILSVGQTISMSAGLTGLILDMTGNEKATLIGVGLGSVINIIFNYVFITYWGTEGAALATSLSLVIREIYLVYSVHKKLNINPTILNII